MHAPPRVRGGLVVRLVSLVAGLGAFSIGIACFLESGLGLSPWDALHQGLARHTPLTIGTANICVGVVVLAFAVWLGARVGLGTILNALLIGIVLDRLLDIRAVDRLSDGPLWSRILLLCAGVVITGLGGGFYLGADMGAGPRDSLMVIGAVRWRIRIGIFRGILELAALGAGAALGGTIGVGTLLFALSVGPAIEATFWLMVRLGLATAPGSTPALAIAEDRCRV